MTVIKKEKIDIEKMFLGVALRPFRHPAGASRVAHSRPIGPSSADMQCAKSLTRTHQQFGSDRSTNIQNKEKKGSWEIRKLTSI